MRVRSEEFGEVEAVADMRKEIPALGFGPQEFMEDLLRASKVTIDGAALEGQFQNGHFLIGRGF